MKICDVNSLTSNASEKEKGVYWTEEF